VVRRRLWFWGSGALADCLRLVVDRQRHLLELVSVLLAVMRAEEEVEAAGHGDSYVGLRAAPIATI
jgi:hypothetical protein